MLGAIILFSTRFKETEIKDTGILRVLKS